ncbi:Putative transcription factor bHLH041 [Linum perenne]
MNHPFVELYEPQLMRMASILPQRLFYKTAVFMGCRSGEIEIGWSNLTPQQMRIESEMMKLFPDNFSSGMIQVAAGNQPPSSSSSSLRSPSLDNNSPEYSSFLLNLTAAFHPPNLQAVSISTSSTSSQLQQIMQLLQQPPQSTSLEAMQALAGGHESQVDAAMTRALLAVFTSPSSSNTSSAFSKFSNPTGLVASSSSRRNASMFKRALTYYRRSFMMTRRRRQIEEEEQMNNLAAASRPTSTQLHHMISERRRREKINDSFQSLRALLPPDVKKDKATVLSRTKEYLKSLITQVAQLSQRTQQLESKLLLLSPPPPPAAAAPAVSIREPPPPIPTDQRVDVRLIPVVEETTSEEQYHIVDLQVTLRDCPVSDIVIRVLQFLTQIPHVNLIALQANTETSEQHTPRFSRANFRLQIEVGYFYVRFT